MKRAVSVRIAIVFLLASCGSHPGENNAPPSGVSGADEAIVDVYFDPDVKAIVDKNCVGCHSGVKPADSLNLSVFPFQSNVLTTTEQIGKAILFRITTDNPQQRMPFRKPPLAAADIALIQQWVDQGMKLEAPAPALPPL